MANPYLIASVLDSSVSSSTYVMTVATSMNSGDSLFTLVAASGGVNQIFGVSDTQSNAYVKQQSVTGLGSDSNSEFTAINARPLTTTGNSGGADTITATFNAINTQAKTIYAVGIPNGGSVDTAAMTLPANGNTGASALVQPSVTSGTLAQATETLIAWLVTGTGTSETPTMTGGWTSLGSNHSASGQWVTVAYQNVTSASAVSFSPTGITANVVWIAGIIPFTNPITLSETANSILGQGTLLDSWFYAGLSAPAGTGQVAASLTESCVSDPSASGAGQVAANYTIGVTSDPSTAGHGQVSANPTASCISSAAGAGQATANASIAPGGGISGDSLVTAAATIYLPGGCSLAGAGSAAGSPIQGAVIAPQGAGGITANAVQQAVAALSGASLVAAFSAGYSIAVLPGTGSLTASAVQYAVTASSAAGVVSVTASQGAVSALAGAGAAGAGASQGADSAAAGSSSLAAPASQGAGSALAEAGSLAAPAEQGSVSQPVGAGVLDAIPTVMSSAVLAGAASTVGISHEIIFGVTGITGSSACATIQPVVEIFVSAEIFAGSAMALLAPVQYPPPFTISGIPISTAEVELVND